jgi:hypothetical protein
MDEIEDLLTYKSEFCNRSCDFETIARLGVVMSEFLHFNDMRPELNRVVECSFFARNLLIPRRFPFLIFLLSYVI